MNSTPQPPAAAGEHFADAERLLAALPLVKRRADRDRHVQIALVHAVLAIAAGIIDARRREQRRMTGLSYPVDVADGRGTERIVLLALPTPVAQAQP
jgi:hypothetical protein